MVPTIAFSTLEKYACTRERSSGRPTFVASPPSKTLGKYLWVPVLGSSGRLVTLEGSRVFRGWRLVTLQPPKIAARSHPGQTRKVKLRVPSVTLLLNHVRPIRNLHRRLHLRTAGSRGAARLSVPGGFVLLSAVNLAGRRMIHSPRMMDHARWPHACTAIAAPI